MNLKPRHAFFPLLENGLGTLRVSMLMHDTIVNALAEIPDAPPRFFIWRNIRHNVVKADGPERIHGEWWASDQEIGLQRDYYRVENMHGERFWLFRDAPADQGGRWWLHGIGEA